MYLGTNVTIAHAKNTNNMDDVTHVTGAKIWDVEGSAKDKFILMLVERIEALERTVWQLNDSATDTFMATVQANDYLCIWKGVVSIVASAFDKPDIAEVRFLRSKSYLPPINRTMMEDMFITKTTLDVVVRFRERLIFDVAASKLMDYATTFKGRAKVTVPWQRQPTSNQPTSNQPTSNQPTSNQPTSNQPTSNQSTSNQSTSNAPKTDDCVYVYIPSRQVYKAGCTDLVTTQNSGRIQ
jgi:hypothetical protein